MSEQQFKYSTNFGFEKIITYIEQGKKITTRDYYTLCRSVSSIRKSTGQGDLRPMWEARLMSEVCRRHKLRGCSPVDSLDVRKIGLDDIRGFYTALKHWKALNGKMVPEGMAEKRAKICSECPKNVPIVGCFGCQNVLPAVLKLVKDRSTTYDESLKGCSVCGCSLRAKVHFPIEVMENSDPNDFPDNCWIKNEWKS